MIWIIIGLGFTFLLGLVLSDAIRDDRQIKRGAQHVDQGDSGRNSEASGADIGEPPLEQPQGDPRKESYLNKPENKVSFATLLFVGAYTVITIFMWCTQRDTEYRQLRAYVLSQHVKVFISNTAPNLKIELVFKNYGSTPAYRLRGWHCVVVNRFENDADGALTIETNEANFPEPPFSDNTAPARTVAPQEIRNVLHPGFCGRSGMNGRVMTTEELASIQSGKAAIYLYGELRYGYPHVTHYRLVGPGDGPTFNTKEGNESD
ncbi:hypothetical protein ACVIIW_006208 [Bradyrhizobium sp. USDA 4449]